MGSKQHVFDDMVTSGWQADGEPRDVLPVEVFTAQESMWLDDLPFEVLQSQRDYLEALSKQRKAVFDVINKSLRQHADKIESKPWITRLPLPRFGGA